MTEPTAAEQTTYRGGPPSKPRHLGDFALTPRVLPITGLALAVGAAGAGAAYCLLRLIGLVELNDLLHARRKDHHEEHHRQRDLTLRGTRTPAPGHAANAPHPGHPSHPPAHSRQRTTVTSEEP